MKRLIARNTSTNTVVADRVGVAATRAERAVGLLSKSGLEPGEALWIVPSRGVHTWGMRFPIDVIFAKRDGRVVKICRHVGPWRLLFGWGAYATVELPNGAIDRSGVAVGDRLELA